MLSSRILEVVWRAALLLAVPSVTAEVRIDLVGQWGGSAHAVDFDGTYAYVGVGPRLVVVDLSNPRIPTRIGQTPPLGHIPTAITLYQGRCYVGLITGMLHVVDVRDPSHPTVLGTCALDDRVVDIAVQDNVAIASTESAGIYVLDVSSPEQPTILFNVDNPNYDGGTVRIRGRYAYCIEDGLRVLDLIDPAHPATLGVNGEIFGPMEVVTYGQELWGILAGASGIEAIYLNDPWVPYSPMWVGDYRGGGSEIAIDGNVLCLTGLAVYEQTSPLQFDYRATIPSRTNSSSDVAVRNGIACATDWYEGLQIVDVHDPRHSALLSYFEETNHSLHVSASDGRAFVSGYRPGVQVLDVSDPSNARRIAEWDGVFTYRVRVRGSIAVIADADGLKTMDISHLQSPRLLGSLPMDDEPADFVLDGSYAYVANLAAGLTVVDLTDPTAPRTIARVDPGSAVGIAKRGDSLYLAMVDQGLQIVDVTLPSDPVLLGRVVTPGLAYSVAVIDETAYVASLGGVCVVDCSDLFAPRFVTRLPGDSQWQTIEAEGDRVFVAANPGLRVLDASSPLAPRLIGRYTDQGWEQGLAYADGLVFLATDSGGLEILAVRPAGDLDGDGSVGLFDLGALLSSFGTCAGAAGYDRYADLDGDQCVTVHDLSSILAAFGR